MWTRDGWCTACRQRLDAGNRPRCDRCAAVLAQPSPYSIGCATCYDQTLPFAGVISVGNYEGLLQQLVTQAKNQHDETLTGQLGRLLADEVTRHRLAPEIDLAVTIPSHWLRQLRNGFHAAWLIAQNVQKITGIRQSQRILRSVKPTEKQGTLSRTGRAANVRGAFECRRPESVTDKTVLLVDDVMTSGATLCEATRVLQKAGARKVIVGVLARATVAA